MLAFNGMREGVGVFLGGEGGTNMCMCVCGGAKIKMEELPFPCEGFSL